MKFLPGRILLLYAVRMLRRLRFETMSEDKKLAKKKKLSSLAGVISLGGDSVKDSEGYYE